VTCDDCHVLRIELEVAAVCVAVMVVLAVLVIVAFKAMDWLRRRRDSEC
jgi:hypothetical protein